MSQPLWAPARGTMHYWDDEGDVHTLDVAGVGFTLFKLLPAYPEGAIQLSLTVVTAEQTITDKEDPEFEHSLAPTLLTDWLNIAESDLKTRGKDALGGYHLRYTDDMESFDERPAMLQDHSYGGVVDLELGLTWDGDAQEYLLTSRGVDEFERRFDLNARFGLFKVGIRHEDGSQNAQAEAWLEKHFDTTDMTVAWEKKGPADGGWYDLYARYTQ